MAIPYKVKNPKTIEEAHQNIAEIADSAMNKNAISDITTVKPVTIGTAGVTYDPVQMQQVIDQQKDVLDKLNDLLERILKS